MECQTQPCNSASPRARREFAESRTRLVWLRIGFYLIAATLGAILISLPWVALAGLLAAAARLVELRAARAFLDAGSRSLWILLATANAASAVTALSVPALIWVSTSDGEAPALGLLFLLAVAVAIGGGPVIAPVVARQTANVTAVIGLTLRDILSGAPGTASDPVAQCIPAAAYLASVAGLTYWTARVHDQRARHMQELATLRTQAADADRAKARFIATLGHELRTSLNGILGITQMLLAGDLGKDQRRQLEVAAESGRDMTALLDDVLDLSKLEAGELAIVPAPDDLRQTAEHLDHLYGPSAAAKNLAFDIEIAPGTPTRLTFDAMRVRQCLSNLISNALKFTETGSVSVAFSAERRPDDPARYVVSVTVSDTGMGIAPVLQPGLFQPYRQADSRIARRFGGTGLGLSITRQLAEAMGGTVDFTSVPGKGSEFRLTFSADETHDPAPAAAPRILVADDTATNRTVIRLLLQPLTDDIVEVADGVAAIGALETDRFDAALIDLNMPGLGGAELAARIRAGAGGQPDLPLVAVTADSTGAGIMLGREGFDGLVAKPVNREHLLAAVDEVLRRRVSGATDRPGSPSG